MSFRWLLPWALGSLGSAASSPPSLVVAFQGRADAEASAYDELLAALQREGEERKVEIFYPKKGTFQEMEPEVQELMAQHLGAFLVYMGHGMGTTGGASAAQHYAATATAAKARLVLLAGFLERVWRPDIAACMKTWSVQPTLKCPKGLCPGGYLKDGVHNCSGPTIPSPSYPGPPSLSIGGELDGLVRMSRMAEAWYTQQATQHKVKLVLGMSHSDLMSSIPSSVAAQDLPSECGASDARTQVSKLILDFLLAESLEISPEAEIFGPFVEMFAKEEGSWWWTSYSDEQGSSSWAANAQRRLVDPLPCSGASGAWHVENEFHLLSDEGLIPPYYRPKHRPNLTKDESGGFLRSLTVAQLRYVELSVLQVAAGLNGWAVIKEEKAGVLADRKMAIKDDGGNPTSAIEIGTKLVSREAAFKACGAQTSPSLDQGDRCKSINQDAYQLALNVSSQRALSRFQRLGRPLVMAADKKPTPPAGPWWIWNYLSYTDKSSEVEVASWYAFYPLSGPAYGAGNHYCKLLSPARALEWIYIDGLRKAPKNVNEVNLSVVV